MLSSDLSHRFFRFNNKDMANEGIRVYELEKSGAELRRKVAEATRRRDYARVSLLMDQLRQIDDKISRQREAMEFLAKGDVMDSHKRDAMGKIFYLSTAAADLSIFLLDMYFASFKDRGMVPVGEWQSVRANVVTATRKFREYMRGFIASRDGAEQICYKMDDMLTIVRDKFFTDRERVFFDEFYDKSADV